MDLLRIPGFWLLRKVARRTRRFLDSDSLGRDADHFRRLEHQLAQLRSEVANGTAEQELLVEQVSRLTASLEAISASDSSTPAVTALKPKQGGRRS